MNCPYCLSEIETADEAVRCKSCGELYHPDCWSQNGGCCARGCRRAVISVEVDAHPAEGAKLEVSREAAEAAAPHAGRKISNPCIKCGRQVAEGELHCPECAPPQPENQDARNVGPLLVVLTLIVLALGWVFAAAYLTGNQVP